MRPPCSDGLESGRPAGSRQTRLGAGRSFRSPRSARSSERAAAPTVSGRAVAHRSGRGRRGVCSSVARSDSLPVDRGLRRRVSWELGRRRRRRRMWQRPWQRRMCCWRQPRDGCGERPKSGWRQRPWRKGRLGRGRLGFSGLERPSGRAWLGRVEHGPAPHLRRSRCRGWLRRRRRLLGGLFQADRLRPDCWRP